MDNTLKSLLKDANQDDRIEAIDRIVRSRLCNKLGGVSEIPAELEYIVSEVTLARYNRIGSEGLSSHNVEGESQTWSQDDFAPYERDIQNWLDRQEGTTKGRIVFI